MFNSIKCWCCDNEMQYIYDEEMENMKWYRFDCTECGESVVVPTTAPFLKKKEER